MEPKKKFYLFKQANNFFNTLSLHNHTSKLHINNINTINTKYILLIEIDLLFLIYRVL